MAEETEYETKSLRFDPEDGVSTYRLTVTGVKVGDNKTLNDSGFRSDMMLFTLLEEKPMVTTYDPYTLKSVMNDDPLKEFALQLKKSFVSGHDTEVGWYDIKDGDKVTASDLK